MKIQAELIEPSYHYECYEYPFLEINSIFEVDVVYPN